MEKRGQFFIIGAVILGLIILGTASSWNFMFKKDISQEKFNAVCDNYRHEINEISKNTVQAEEKTEENQRIQDFTSQFLAYTDQVEPNFRLIYVYGNNDEAIVGNYIGYQVKVNDIPFENEEVKNVDHPETIRIINETRKIDKEYDLDIDDEFHFIAMEEKGGERYVCE